MTPRLFTTVEVPPFPFRIEPGCPVVSLGSCFADSMARRLEEGGFGVERNPFGTLYNPASVAAALARLVDDREVVADDLVQHEGLWHSWHHHGSFSRPDAGECLSVCNSRIHRAHRTLSEARLLMVTFGTAWVYEREVGNGERGVVANCHKLPAAMFGRRRMGMDEIVALWQRLLQERLWAFNSRIKVVFTVSPIRHMADGAHGNQLSKATLLLAIDEIVSMFNSQYSISYFPAYEIVLDELRDYRFYGPDLAHPSDLAEELVWDRFCQACMSPAVIQQVHNNQKQHKRLMHNPLHFMVESTKS